MSNPLIYTPNTKALTIRSIKDKVIILLDGKLIATMPWEAAKEFAAAIKHQAGLSEEYTKADQVSSDQAMLIRSGLPINLANLSDVQKLAWWKAQNDDNARRVPVKGIPSKGKVGAPGLIKGDPKDG